MPSRSFMASTKRLYRPPSISDDMSTASSREPSPTPSCEADVDTDDERSSRGSDYRHSRPLSVHIPAGPYCVRRPTLSDIISNTAPPPYSLSAFMAYLSNNHCLETLEFTMDANRYRKHFYSHAPPGQPAPPPGTEGCKYMKMLWQKLMDAYIVRNGPREVNLPCSVRDRLLGLSRLPTPPQPDSLDPAVNIVYDLMQESAMMGFLNHCQSAATVQTPWHGHDSDDEAANARMNNSFDERVLAPGRKRGHSPPIDYVSSSYSSSSGRSSSQYRPASSSSSPFSVSLGWNRHSTPPLNSSQTSAWEPSQEEQSSSSPTIVHPMTPPGTPPADLACSSHAPRPKSSLEKNSWKKMAGKMGMNAFTHTHPHLKSSNSSGSHKIRMEPGMSNCAALQSYPCTSDMSQEKMAV